MGAGHLRAKGAGMNKPKYSGDSGAVLSLSSFRAIRRTDPGISGFRVRCYCIAPE